MRETWANTLGALLFLACLDGCATRYQPRPGPRLSVVMEGGRLAYLRDGETIGHGLLGHGLVEAVEDDPAAREAAEAYHSRMVGGFVAQIVGLGCFVGGTGWALSEDNDEDQRAIFAGALACWLAGAITGSVLVLTAQPYQWDAINIYNDNVEARGYPFPPPYPIFPKQPPPPAAVPRPGPAPPPATP